MGVMNAKAVHSIAAQCNNLRMPGDIEAIGDTITGATIARAVEPEAGEGAVGAGTCLNCGAALAGRHCHDCGQAATVHRSLAAFWHDFTHSILHFEGKIWRTLPLLAFKPGELTRRYVHGERAKFVSPLALFLFSVFLMFAVFSLVGAPLMPEPEVRRDGIVQAQADIERDLTAARATIADISARRAKATDGPLIAELDKRLAAAQANQRQLELGRRLARDGLSSPIVLDDGDVDTGDQALDARIREAARNPQLLLYKMQSNAYKFSWALIPLSIPFVWLAFAFRRQFKLYDHAIFVSYSIAFMTLFAVAMALVVGAGAPRGFAETALGVVPPVHIFAQLKGAYALGWGAALWRAAFLAVSAVLVIGAFAFMLLALGLAG
jgi:hypothetical protein